MLCMDSHLDPLLLLMIETPHPVLDVSGRPNTRDYGKALEALKLLTENVLREPRDCVMATTRLVRAHNYS